MPLLVSSTQSLWLAREDDFNYSKCTVFKHPWILLITISGTRKLEHQLKLGQELNLAHWDCRNDEQGPLHLESACAFSWDVLTHHLSNGLWHRSQILLLQDGCPQLLSKQHYTGPTHTHANPEWTITPGMVECLMEWPRESKPGAGFKNNIYLLQLAEQWRKSPLRSDFTFAEHFVISTISPDNFWGQVLFVFPICKQGGSGEKEMPCSQLCRAHADRTLACWNGSIFFSCLPCLGSCLRTRPLLDSLGPRSLLVSRWGGMFLFSHSKKKTMCCHTPFLLITFLGHLSLETSCKLYEWG